MQYVTVPVVLCLLVILQPYVLGEESNDVEKKNIVEREASLSEEEADKRGSWTDLNVWGKRNWQKLPSSVWGKRGWHDLSSAWGKRGWDRLNGAWGKRGNDWARLTGWGKRADWSDLRLWGKRDEDGWTKLRMWGKRFDNSDRGDYAGNGESFLSKDDLNEYLTEN